MAAKTPDTIIRESLGKLKLHICDFTTTNIDNEDTYASGITSIVGEPIFAVSVDPTSQGDENCNVVTTTSTGSIEFHSPQDNLTGTLYIYSRD